MADKSKFAADLERLSPQQLADVQNAVKGEQSRRAKADPQTEFNRRVSGMSDNELAALTRDLQRGGGNG